jgi:Calcineurin-like phosphoesterase
MDDPSQRNADEIIAIIRKAASANLDSRGREGLLIELPEHGNLIVAGDLHGNLANLERLVAKADLKNHPKRQLVLQELVHPLNGDMGDNSWRAVEAVARLKVRFPKQVHCLLGNHEFAETVGLEVGKRGKSLNQGFAEALEQAYGHRWEDIREAYRQFWRTSPMALHTPNRLFIAHSTPHGDRLGKLSLDYLRRVSPVEAFRKDSAAFHMLWGRDYRPEVADALVEPLEAEFFIVGHTPCEGGMSMPNHRHLILDCTHYDAHYVALPLGCALTLEDIKARTRRLYPLF